MALGIGRSSDLLKLFTNRKGKAASAPDDSSHYWNIVSCHLFEQNGLLGLIDDGRDVTEIYFWLNS